MIDLPKVLPVAHLNGHHRRTLASILRHPTAHNVEWHDVVSLLNTIATMTELHSGKIELSLGDDRITLGRTHGKDVSADELRQLRTFLSTAGFDSPVDAEPVTDADEAEQSWVVLVDHRQAKLFALGGVEVAAPLIVSPEDPHGHLRHLEHRREGDHDGGRVAENDGYYENIASDLVAASNIAILSDGKGKSSAGEYLLDCLTRHHPEIAGRVVGVEAVDISHMSDGEIVAVGRSQLAAREVV